MDPRSIVMDTREEAEDLTRELVQTHGFVLQRALLPLGDYCIGRDTLVERKTTRDFALSIIDGRLFGQAYRLATRCEHALLVIEGESFSTDIQVETNAIRGALITLAQTFRLPVLRTRHQADTAWTFARLYEQRLRIGQGQGPPGGTKARRLQTRRERLLRQLPGIGPEIARRLLDRFGSVVAVVSAPAAELRQVPGVGPKRAAALLETVNEGPAPWDPQSPPPPPAE
jgi:Fanconi anemia group M protein